MDNWRLAELKTVVFARNACWRPACLAKFWSMNKIHKSEPISFIEQSFIALIPGVRTLPRGENPVGSGATSEDRKVSF